MLLSSASRPSTRVAALIIVWLAAATRLLYLAYINQPPADGMLFAPLCGVDAHIYNRFGQNLLIGEWPGIQPLFRTPLYTLYLGLVYELSGINHYTPLIIQSLLHAVAAAALYKTGQMLFSRWAGLLAALGYVSYGSLFFFVGCFAPISLVLPLLILTLFFALKFYRQQSTPSHEKRPSPPAPLPLGEGSRASDGVRVKILILVAVSQRLSCSYKYLVVAGLLLGLAALGRPTVLVVAPAVVGWLFLRRAAWHRWAAQTLVFGCAVALPVLPATIFNYSVSSQFILVSGNGPEVLFISNNPDAEGRDILAPGIPQPAHRRFEAVIDGIKRNETTFTREVINYISSDPLDWLALELNKLWLLFGKTDLNLLTISYSYPTTSRQIGAFRISPVQWYGLIITALLGMALIPHKHKSLLLLFFGLMTLANIIFFIQLRFRVLLIPVVLLYSAAMLASAPGWFRSVRSRYYLVVTVLIFCIPYAPDVWVFALAMLGIGLWQSVKLELWPQTRWMLLAGWSLLILTLLTGQIIRSAPGSSQREDYYLGPEIGGDIFMGQTFQPACDGLNRVQLVLGLHTEQHDQPVNFYLRSQTDGQEIVANRFSPQNLTDRTTLDFTFPPQPDSSHHTYLAFVTSPTSHPGNSITLRGFSELPVDWYTGGTAMLGQGEQMQPFPGDLAFAAYCDAPLLQTISTAFGLLPGPTWIYWVGLIGHIVLLLLSVVKVINDHLYCQRS